MIGKAKWFNPRKYTGWGMTPNCWQGWVYIAIVALPIILINNIPLNGNLKTGFMVGWGILFAIDLIDIMIKMKRDERENLHEAIAERNALWFMIMALSFGVAFQAGKSAFSQSFEVDPIILIALLGASAVKAVTHLYLKDK